jgi:ATP-dependent 26S proteasome regulatory subunit
MDSNSNQNLLNQIEKISKEATKCNLNFEQIVEVKDDIEKVSEFLDISHDQTILFACLVELSLQNTVTLTVLAKHFRCSVLKIINLVHEIEVLEHKKYVETCFKSPSRKHLYNDIGYTVPHNVIESLRTMDKCKLDTKIHFSFPNLLEQITQLIYEREENLISTQILFEQVEFMLSNHRRLPFIQFVNDNVKLTVNKCVVCALAFYRFKREYAYNIEHLADRIFNDFSEQMEYVQDLLAGYNELVKKDIIRLQESDFMDDKVVTLTKRAIEILYKHYSELYVQEESRDGIIKAKAIKRKRLFYDNGLKRQIESLSNALLKKNFREFQTKLHESNLPKGITAIFYGQSGTGKTETAYQIAKKTNRDIMMVELSQVKSKWFGESEKQVKKIFDDYKRLFNNNIIKPILFINEADGMFSKRLGINGTTSSTDQTVNTIKNIILQELENFEGILFATTNLSENLDSAFERRFLFKVEFKNPVPEISERIWKSKLPELTPIHIKSLSTKFQLSGGEIENVVRKYTMEKVIEKKQLSLDRLMEFCELEKPFQKQNKIGFRKD